MHLAEAYALSCGVKIDRPFISKAFYPITASKYITIHSQRKSDSRRYEFFDHVLTLLKSKLDDYAFLQVGSKNDPRIEGTLDLRHLSYSQMAYVISQASVHIGEDSFPAHLAGYYNIPLVSLYSNLHPSNSRPYWGDRSKQRILQADLKGKKPSYSDRENPKTINTIFPEVVANAALDLLNLPLIKRETLHIGRLSSTFLIEIVPNFILAKGSFGKSLVTIRMDYLFNELVLQKTLENVHRAAIVTNRELNLNLIRREKNKIELILYQVSNSTNISYIEDLKSTGVNVELFTEERDEEKVRDLRLKFFEVGEVEVLPEKSKEDIDLHLKIDRFTRYTSKKNLLSEGKIFLSRADWQKNRPVKKFGDLSLVIDEEEFYQELDYFYIFNEY